MELVDRSYKGFYARLEPANQKQSGMFMSADNLVGDKSKVPGINRGYHNALNKALGIVGKWEEGRVHVTRRISQTVAICILSEDFELKRIQNIQRTLHQFYNENYEQIQKANKE